MQTAALHLETLLHGHLAGEDAGTAVVIVDSDRELGPRSAAAPRPPPAAVGEIGMPVATPRRPAGRRRSAAPSRACSRGAAALQSLTLALVAARGVNPDLIRREEEPYRRAGEAGEGGGDW